MYLLPYAIVERLLSRKMNLAFFRDLLAPNNERPNSTAILYGGMYMCVREPRSLRLKLFSIPLYPILSSLSAVRAALSDYSLSDENLRCFQILQCIAR